MAGRPRSSPNGNPNRKPQWECEGAAAAATTMWKRWKAGTPTSGKIPVSSDAIVQVDLHSAAHNSSAVRKTQIYVRDGA